MQRDKPGFAEGWITGRSDAAELRERLAFALRQWEQAEFEKRIDRGDTYAAAGAFAEGAVRDGMARFERARKGVPVAPLA